MLNVVRVEFSKLRRWKLLRVLPLLSLVLPAITFSYFATHPDYLTDMGLYKQALFSFNIFLILPAILGVLASMLVYNEQRCDVLKQLWIIPVSKGGYLFAKWVVVLTASLAFMMLAVGFTFAFGLAFGFLSWNGEMMAFVLYKENVIAIPRSGKAEHVLQNLEAGKVHLTVEEYARLDAAFPAPRKKTYLDIV